MTTKAIPLSAGIASKNAQIASSPPAEAPIPATQKPAPPPGALGASECNARSGVAAVSTAVPVVPRGAGARFFFKPESLSSVHFNKFAQQKGKAHRSTLQDNYGTFLTCNQVSGPKSPYPYSIMTYATDPQVNNVINLPNISSLQPPELMRANTDDGISCATTAATR